MGQGGGKGASDPETVAAVKKKVEDYIKSRKVVIFAKGYCPYCHMASDVSIVSFKTSQTHRSWLQKEEK
jgi:hypothetical protein